MSDKPSWLTPQVEALFADPRFVHLRSFSETLEQGLDDTDGAVFAQIATAVYMMQSAEKTSATLTKATWALVLATVGLVIATVVLVIVTVST